MYTGADGTYRFEDVPDGAYTLRLWWTPGFYDVATPAGYTDSEITVDVSGERPVTSSSPLDSTRWAVPVADGTLPFPSEAVTHPDTIATGVLDVGATAPD